MMFHLLLISLGVYFIGCGTGNNGGDPNRFMNGGAQKARQPGISMDGKPIPGYNPVDIPLISPSGRVCSGTGISMYTWGYEVWNNTDSPVINFLQNPKVAANYGCGDVYINVADYSAPRYIRDEYALVPFIRNVRATGNRGIVFLVYGDVQVSSNGAPNGPTEFADTFFDWLWRIEDADLQAMVPLGVSYDCEHLSHLTIENALNRAQQLKADFVKKRLGGDASLLTIEWTIEGQEKPHDTDIVMKLSDRALMMAYRNHVATSERDPRGEDNIITRVMDFMFTKQCTHCLDDSYAAKHYKAKIKIMMEADCLCGQSCHKISFCAYDAKADVWGRNNHSGVKSYSNGAQYMMGTITEAEKRLRDRLGPSKYQRLFGTTDNLSLFVIHNWNWFTCYFDDPSLYITTPIGTKRETCSSYHIYANSCRSQ